MTELATALAAQRVRVSVISAASADDLRDFPRVPFQLVADPGLNTFRKYGAYDGGAKHATLAFDATGREIFRQVGDEPLRDARELVQALKRHAK